jgi:hypothetical protein
MKPSESAQRLADMINKAIADGKVTNLEFDRIMMIADEDSHHDKEEKNLLAHLQELIACGTVKRVAE